MRTNIECLGPYQLDPAVFSRWSRDVSYETVIAGMRTCNKVVMRFYL